MFGDVSGFGRLWHLLDDHLLFLLSLPGALTSFFGSIDTAHGFSGWG